MKRKAIVIGVTILAVAGSIFLWIGESQSSSKRKVFLIGVDGASLDMLRRLASENKVPNLQKLMERGASGYLDSISWRKKTDKSYGLFSPIIWSSIATGKLPSKHGVEDFRLPLPGTMSMRMGYLRQENPILSTLIFPFHSRDHMSVVLTARLPPGLKQSTIEAYLNLRPIGEAKLEKEFKQFRFEIPPDLIQWKENQLMFRFYESIQVENQVVGVDVESIRVYNASGHEILDYCNIRQPEMFRKGWIPVKLTQLALASSFHLRTRTLWEIASALNRRVGVVGWWASWPATPINGYMVSSHVGLQGERLKFINRKDFLSQVPDLTYPPEILDDIRKIYFPKDQVVPDFEKRFFKLKQCGCVGSVQERIALTYFWQDKFFAKISTEFLKKKDVDLFAVYFRGTDTMSHQFLGFNQSYDLVLSECEKFPTCELERLHKTVDNYYSFLDAEIGEILKMADRNTYIFVVTDHGEFAKGRKGVHKNNGFILAAGPGIRKHNFQKASVLDVTPTILYLMGLPVAQDMDGSVLKEAFDRNLILERPIAYIDSYDKMIGSKSQHVVVDKSLEEQQAEELKALGYIN